MNSILKHSLPNGELWFIDLKRGLLKQWIMSDGYQVFGEEYPLQDGESIPAIPMGGVPLLFPFAGRVWDAQKRLGFWKAPDGKNYSMPTHGFAHSLLEWKPFPSQTASELILTAESNSKTREHYPFDFRLRLIFSQQNHELVLRLETSASAANLHPMPFAIGWHIFFSTQPQLAGNDPIVYKIPTQSYFEVSPEGNASVEQKPRKGLSAQTMWELPFDDPLTANGILGPLSEPHLRIIGNTLRSIHLQWSWYQGYAVLWKNKNRRDYFCVEPWMNLPDAPSRSPLKYLNPGEIYTTELKIYIEEKLSGER